jgi:hypothetical protein
MKRVLFVGLVCAGTAFATFAQAEQGKMMKMSKAECSSVWSQASKDGKPLTEAQAAAYITDFKAANPDGDSTIEKAEFQKACAAGLVKGSSSTGMGTGEMGTEAPKSR